MPFPAANTTGTPAARPRATAVTLDDLVAFVAAASAALPATLAAAPVERTTAPLSPAAAVAPAPERPVVAAPGAHARYAALIESYDKLIRGIVGRVGRRLGLTRDNFLAREDIEQEVRLDLWKQVARGQTIDFPATYIYKSTIRETLRALRRNAQREVLPLDTRGAEQADPVDPFHLMAAKEQFRELILALRCLTPDRQSAVRAHISGFGFNEIMSLYGWSYQKTRNLIARGMADLRKSLNANGEAPAEAHEVMERASRRRKAVAVVAAVAIVRATRLR